MFVEYRKVSDAEAVVTVINYESQPTGIDQFEVSELPQAEEILGKGAELYVDLKTNTLFYKYVERPLTQDEKLESMQFENADLMFQNAMQDMAIEQLQADNAELMFMVANSQLGGI